MSFDINNFQSNCLGKSSEVIVITNQDFSKDNYIKSDYENISSTGTVDLVFNAIQNMIVNKNDIIYSNNGSLGSQGPQGFMGIQGLIGNQGFIGNIGLQGVQGVQGVQGLQGVQGNIGLQGLQGVQGVIGIQGSRLIISRTINSFSDIYSLYTPNIYEVVHVKGGQLYMFVGSTNGSTGPDNSYTFVSDIIDESLLSINGTQGSQGFQGIQGFQGSIGFQGEQGNPVVSISATGNIMLSNISGAVSNSMLYFQNNNIYSLTGYLINIKTDSRCFGILKENPSFTIDMGTDGARKLSTNTWITGSDERVKENIEDANLDICYNIVKNLKLKRFKWKEEMYPNVNDRNSIGFIAQEVEQYFPNSIKENSDFGFTDFKNLDADQIYKTMYGALQKVITELENLEQTLGIQL